MRYIRLLPGPNHFFLQPANGYLKKSIAALTTDRNERAKVPSVAE